MNQVSIRYLYHSGFLVQTAKTALVFDYYNDTADTGRRALEFGIMEPALFALQKGLVLVSHNHTDHFNPVIFKWHGDGRDVRYVVDNGVTVRDTEVIRVSPGDTVTTQDAVVRVFGSTDEGCSFHVCVDGINIFHAGDLNFWHWKNEPDSPSIATAKEGFLAVMRSLQGLPMDVAFFPVDARMGEGFAMGAAYFVRQCQPKWLVPMHFTALPHGAALFARQTRVPGTKIWLPEERGEKRVLAL